MKFGTYSLAFVISLFAGVAGADVWCSRFVNVDGDRFSACAPTPDQCLDRRNDAQDHNLLNTPCRRARRAACYQSDMGAPGQDDHAYERTTECFATMAHCRRDYRRIVDLEDPLQRLVTQCHWESRITPTQIVHYAPSPWDGGVQADAAPRVDGAATDR